MNIDVDTFTEDQKKFLYQLASDLGGPTSTGSVLMILERTMYMLKPDIDLHRPSDADKDLWEDLEVCMAALHYWKVQNVMKE